jgi:3-hydroxybutyryl-CoA dehydrogenase
MVGEMIGAKLFEKIAVLGMGRMAIGLGIDLALQGIRVDMIDLKPRSDKQRRQYEKGLKEECEAVVRLLDRNIGSFPFPAYFDNPTGGIYDLIFEGLPEEIPTKQAAFSRLGGVIGKETLICSMTSTFTVEELTKEIDPPLNILVTHFMNPPYLVPFLEVVSHPKTDPRLTDRLLAFLRRAGHMPIRCESSPGFVISRLQLCLMNEAVRIMEERVASPEDIDKAIKYGWGYRFPIMGILEFIDVGGLEILYHAGRSVSKALNRPDLVCPKLVKDRFREGAIGIKALKGIFAYESHEQVKKNDLERLRKQVRIKVLLDAIHREEGAWE